MKVDKLIAESLAKVIEQGKKQTEELTNKIRKETAKEIFKKIENLEFNKMVSIYDVQDLKKKYLKTTKGGKK